MQVSIFNSDFTLSSKWYLFKETTELGRIYDTIDWDGLSKLLPVKNTLRGCPSWLKPQGLFGLMFLKHYSNLSDEKLLEHFNTNWSFQLFCGTLLTDNEAIRDNSFVSRIRTYLAQHTDFEQIQTVLIQYWNKSNDLEQTNLLLMDATCYESYIRYPTDIKLLWECCQWIWERTIPEICKAFKIKQPRSKYIEQKKKQHNYNIRRKKSHSRTQVRKRSLLKLLIKGIDSLELLMKDTNGGNLSVKLNNTFKTIRTIYAQQDELFKNPQCKVNERIVSLFKPYVRAIKRGKENKPVEFGMKVHMNQVDNINIIEHASFDNFNECKRLKISVLKHLLHFNTCTHLGADRIYPTNENRTFISRRGMQTNFDKKGPKKEDKETKRLKSVINKGRGSYMEGSFGNEKNHYGLRKIKARTKETELIWLCFGVMTANAVKIKNKRQAKLQDNTRQAA